MASKPESSLPLDTQVVEPITPAGSSSAPLRRAKDNQERFLSKLADQGFSTRHYPDPLAPRQGPDRRLYPKGVTPEMERKWLARIRAARDGSQPEGDKVI